MWGVLIFLRFFYVVGHAGVGVSLVIVLVSFLSSFFTVMSLSAMATNGPVEAGGAYYIISRALGHKLGGAVGCTYYLGLSLLAVLEVLGAIEVMLYMDSGLELGMGEAGGTRAWAVLLLGVLTVLVWGGMALVSRAGLFFAAVVGLTLSAYYASLVAAPLPGSSPLVTGLRASTLRSNWGEEYTDGITFSDVLSVFFPCFTGILSGANRSKALKDPEKSIPRGTLTAICLSACLYTSYMIMWGAVADRDYLKYGPSFSAASGRRRRHLLGGGSESMSVVSEMAWPDATVVQIGVIIASLSQALQCLITAPQVLNAIAADGTVPFLNVAAPLNKDGEPHIALFMTTGICLCASMIGSLDLVAPLLSICFLCAYAALNFSTFALGLTKAPSWRPTWRYFHWSLGLAGFLLCTTLAFVIRWYFALVAIVLLAALVFYIESRQVQVDWGSALGGIRLDLATAAMLNLAHERRHSSNWRPQLLCLPSWPCRVEKKGGGGGGTAGAAGDTLLNVAAQLKKGRGLCVVAEVEEGNLSTDRGLSTRVNVAKERLRDRISSSGIKGFAHVVVAPSYRVGKTFAIQGLGAFYTLVPIRPRWRGERRSLRTLPGASLRPGSLAFNPRPRRLSTPLLTPLNSTPTFARMERPLGFGGLEPNTVLLGWPRRNAVDFDEDADDGVDDDDDDAKEEAAQVLVETVCECTAAEKAVLLCLGLDDFPKPSDADKAEGFVDVWWVLHDGGLLLMIAHLLLRHKTWSGCKLRVHTVLQSAQDPSAVRRGLEKVLAEFRIDAEVSVVEAGEDADMYAYTHDWTMRKEQAEQFRDALLAATGGKKDKDKDAGAGLGRLGEDALGGTPGTGTPRGGRDSLDDPSSGNATPPRSGDVSPPGRASTSSPSLESSKKAGLSLRKAFPSEIDLVQGLDHRDVENTLLARRRHDRRSNDSADASPYEHASLSSIFDMSSVSGEKPAKPPLAPIADDSPRPPPAAAAAEAEAGEGAADARPSVSSVTSDDVIIVEEEEADTNPPAVRKRSKSVGFVDNDVTASYSPAPQPAATKKTDAAAAAAAAAAGGWVEDASGPAALNKIIRGKSQDARLVIVNLPDPDAIVMRNPSAYARYIEALVKGLPRVIFVHGTGREVYTSAEMGS
jgi:amino acid transporter